MSRPLTLGALLLFASCARSPSSTVNPPASGVDAGITRSTEASDAGEAVAAGSSCPLEEPTRGMACTEPSKRCAYGPRRDCGTIWDCYDNFWDPIATVPCFDAHQGRCPAEPSKTAPAGVTPEDDLSCVYPNGIVCSFRYPEVPQQCSGVMRPNLEPRAMPTWTCANVAAPCARTNLQGHCTSEGMTCGPRCCGTGLVCENGQWVPRSYPCPP